VFSPELVQNATIRPIASGFCRREKGRTAFGRFLSTDYAKRRFAAGLGARSTAAQQILRRRHAGRIRNYADAHIVAMR
jgi:hypothetical protein